ncbi:O-antigen ligase family protein [Bacteroides sp. UBA939]|uniref:O-antigen ligase family protein n=1 Tax=Bacteroides sp. UBA939 TaxID=1946092 RepID=UPI0025C02A20|nr:O-antigen ligase family protein [Bacteroides sp. UBA939]
MKITIDYIVSILLGLVVIASVSGLPSEILSNTKMFAIFGVSGVSFIISIFFFIIVKKDAGISKLDIFSFGFLVFYLINFSDLKGLWNIGCLCLLLLFVIIRFMRRIHYAILFKSCLCAITLLACWGYLQYFGYISSNSNFFLLTGPFHNPAILAVMLSLLLSVVLNSVILFCGYFRKYRILLMLSITILLFGTSLLILTYARASYVALLLSVLYSLYQKFIVNKQKRNQLLYLIGILFFIFTTIGGTYILKPESANGRLLIWKVSWEMIQDKPLMGHGKGGFAANYLYYQANYMKTSASPAEKVLAGSTHLAFNEPLRIVVEHGLIGLFAYLAFIIGIFLLYRDKNHIAIILKSLLIGIITWGIFAYPDQVFPVLTLWVICIACYLNKRSGSGKSSLSVNRTFSITLIAVVYCASLFLSTKVWIKWKSYHELYACLNAHDFREVFKQTDYFADFRKEMRNDISFSYLYCKLTKMENQDREFIHTVHYLEEKFPSPELLLMKGDYLKEKSLWKEAEAAYKLAADMVPALQMPRGKLAFMYNEIGRRKEAVEIAREILDEHVKVYGFETFKLHRELKRIFEDELK